MASHPKFGESVTETSAFAGLTDHNVPFSPSLDLLNPDVVDRIRPLDAKSRLGTKLSDELSRLRNSIKLQIEARGVLSLHRPIVLSLEAVENVKQKLRRVYDEESIAIVENIKHALHAAGQEENDYSEDFTFWFFVHLHKIANYGKRETDSEWTKLINCIALTTNFYIDFFCPNLFQLCFDSDYGLFCAPNIFCNRRPDFAMMCSAGFINNKPKDLIACIGEAAKEGFEGMIHQDQEKLIKCMRVCIDDQTDHVPLTDCRVIGILHSQTQAKIYEMIPSLPRKSKILVYDVYPLHDGLLELGTAQGLSTFYITLQRVEALVKILKKKFQATIHKKLGSPDELEFLRKFDHPNIVKMLGCYSKPYKDEAAYILVLERLQYIRSTSSTLRALHIARDICAGLVYLHARNIIHRDINPRNIMQDGTGRVKIIDFNLATELQPGTLCFDERVGTGGFTAPEVDRVTSNGYDCKADVYSLGQTMRLLYIRKENYSSTIRKLINWCSLSMWQRPSAKQLLEYIDRAIDRYHSEIDRQKNQNTSSQISNLK